MNHTIHIKDTIKPKGYDVHIGKGLLSVLPDLLDLSRYSKIFFLTDEYTQRLIEEVVKPGAEGYQVVIVVPSGDKNKNIKTVEIIWRELLEHGCDRKSLIINVGGGVIGDMGGFAASTYMRGIDFVQVPTTILAQVDASVGGKVGINFHGIKNSIGSFQQPVAVIIDVDTVRTLPDRHFIEGFGEIIKHGLIADAAYFKKVTSKKPREFTENELIDIITGSVEIKKHIIENDITEKGERKLVNFGHTVGHALESISHDTDQPLFHGEAVSIGMVAEARISHAMGLLSEKEVTTIVSALHTSGLPTTYPVKDHTLLQKKMLSDKKAEAGKIKWTLLKKIGEGVYDQEVPEEIVREVIRS